MPLGPAASDSACSTSLWTRSMMSFRCAPRGCRRRYLAVQLVHADRVARDVALALPRQSILDGDPGDRLRDLRVAVLGVQASR